jgi:TonB family protein
MQIALLFLSVFLLIGPTGLKTQVSQQTANTERPKNAVDRAIEEAKARGEIVMGACVQNCGDGAANESNDEVEFGKVLEMPKPNYPPIARAAHASGTVEVQVLIGLDGTVTAAAAISGHPLLQAAAVGAARQTRFTPPKINGQPVMVAGVLQYNFVGQ